VENKSVPKENVWTMHENFSIVIQQWVLCIIQYIWYSIFNSLKSLELLGVVFTIIFNISLYKFSKLFTNKLDAILAILVVANMSVAGYESARPNIITASTLLIELTLLHKFYIEKSVSFKRFLIELGILSIWQINFQSASWVFLIIMILPYIVPIFIHTDWAEYLSRIKHGLLAILIIFVTGFINPNTVNGMLYLYNSSELTVTRDAIRELTPLFDGFEFDLRTIRTMLSFNNSSGRLRLIFIAEVLLFIICLLRKKLSLEQFWLISGTILLSFCAFRNCYFMIFGLVILISHTIDFKLNLNLFLNKAEYITLCLIYALVLAGLISNVYTTYNTQLIYSDYLDYNLSEELHYLEVVGIDKDNVRFFTDFETGNYFEFYGYKTYMDARPELFMKTINNQEDIWKEYYDVFYDRIDDTELTQSFLDKYNFDYLCVKSNKHLDLYLSLSDDYEKVVYGEAYSLYKNKHN
jgi:hypothetical protein